MESVSQLVSTMWDRQVTCPRIRI